MSGFLEAVLSGAYGVWYVFLLKTSDVCYPAMFNSVHVALDPNMRNLCVWLKSEHTDTDVFAMFFEIRKQKALNINCGWCYHCLVRVCKSLY